MMDICHHFQILKYLTASYIVALMPASWILILSARPGCYYRCFINCTWPTVLSQLALLLHVIIHTHTVDLKLNRLEIDDRGET